MKKEPVFSRLIFRYWRSRRVWHLGMDLVAAIGAGVSRQWVADFFPIKNAGGPRLVESQ